jgi:nucleotide-binding universal stress UspA family protein
VTAGGRPVLAGVDGSPSSLRAVRWAAREAARRGLPLKLLHIRFVPAPEPYTPVKLPRTDHDAALGQVCEWLSEAETVAHEAAPLVPVITELRTGVPAGQLIDESGEADLAVLGSRGVGGFTGLLLGSTVVAVAARSHCALVVVRGESAPETGPVVVGVAGSDHSDAALGFAFETAASRDVPLIAVHAWNDLTLGDAWSGLPLGLDDEAITEEEERELLGEALAAWHVKYPEVEVCPRVVRDRPAHALLEEAKRAQLIVVGRRGRGGFVGLALGSTSQALLYHSECPVAVISSTEPALR